MTMMGWEQPEIGGDTDEKLLCDKPPVIQCGKTYSQGHSKMLRIKNMS